MLDASRCGIQHLPRVIGRLKECEPLACLFACRGGVWTDTPLAVLVAQRAILEPGVEPTARFAGRDWGPRTFGDAQFVQQRASCGAVKLEVACLVICGVPVQHLSELPPTLGYLSSLRSLNLRGNRLKALPGELAAIGSLLSLNVSVNHLKSLPETLRYATAPAGGDTQGVT